MEVVVFLVGIFVVKNVGRVGEVGVVVVQLDSRIDFVILVLVNSRDLYGEQIGDIYVVVLFEYFFRENIFIGVMVWVESIDIEDLVMNGSIGGIVVFVIIL